MSSGKCSVSKEKKQKQKKKHTHTHILYYGHLVSHCPKQSVVFNVDHGP